MNIHTSNMVLEVESLIYSDITFYVLRYSNIYRCLTLEIMAGLLSWTVTLGAITRMTAINQQIRATISRRRSIHEGHNNKPQHHYPKNIIDWLLVLLPISDIHTIPRTRKLLL